jgi:hypothetical protein
MTKTFTFFSLLAALFLTSCETVRTYEGPPKQQEEIGRLFTTGTQPNFRMLTLDGKPLTYISPRVVELLPGTHVLEIAANNQWARFILIPVGGVMLSDTLSGSRYQKGSYRVEFAVRAGFTYAFNYPEKYSGPLPETLCIFGEPHDAPGSKENFTKELRTMSAKAEPAGCAPVQGKTNVEPPAEIPKTSEAK